MVLFDTSSKIVIEDAQELQPGIWVHADYRNICTDTQIGPLGSGKRFALLEDNAPEVQSYYLLQQANDEDLADMVTPQTMKDGIILPKWLNDWLIEQDAFYEVDREQVADGRELNQYGIRWYLGSYFPKSFAEAYIIYSDLFSNSSYNGIIQNKNELSVLDIGCGTGGDTIGLISAIITKLPKIQKIKVLACDYCEMALESLSKLIEHFNKTIGREVVIIDLTTKPIAFAKETTEEEVSLMDFANSLSDKRFDIILSFKMFNELVRNAGFDINSVYSTFAQCFCPLLSNEGTITIEDVSDRVNRIYLSKPLSQSINSFIRSDPGIGYQIISPRPCAIKQMSCNNQDSYCYSQRILKVNYESKYIDETNGVSDILMRRDIDTLITYRILANSKVAEAMMVSNASEYNYQKVFKRADAHSTNTIDHFCGNDSGEVRDAFIISD